MRWVAVGRAGAAVTGALAGALLLVPPATAHVTVDPSRARPGSYATLTFRVPNEKPVATTVQLEVALPEDTPIASVSVKPTTGWTAAETRLALRKPITTADGVMSEAVTRIVWKANTPAAAIQPGQFQEFAVSAGPLPETDRILLKTLQTYSDGTVARWIEEPGSDGAEPENAAPVLSLTEGSAGDSRDDRTVTAQDSDARVKAGTALWLGFGALAISLVSVVLAGLGWRKRPAGRRSEADR